MNIYNEMKRHTFMSLTSLEISAFGPLRVRKAASHSPGFPETACIGRYIKGFEPKNYSKPKCQKIYKN